MNPADREFTHEFDWGLYPQAENFLIQHIDTFLLNNSFAHKLSSRMEHETSTRFFDWIDHIVLPENIVRAKDIEELGFLEVHDVDAPADMRVFVSSKTVFCPILLSKKKFTEVALKPERLDHFIQVIGRGIPIKGDICAPYRKAVIFTQGDYILSAVERRGYQGFRIHEKTSDALEYRQALEIFFCRERHFENFQEGMAATQKLVEDMCKKLSPARVTDAFFRAERMYWERRNRAGQLQKARQDRLGLGWGNHDHHTYRSSRENFRRLIKIFEIMGFTHREQFFAGEEAGWGAQILEHPQCNIVVFADIDLLKEEKDVDFTRYEMKQITHMGTVGLWVGLHGESIFQAGLHHLAARFDFEKLRTDLKQQGVNTMSPFSYFEFLKQAFTEGETWSVNKKRLDEVLVRGFITKAQYETFLGNGAVGSHLENMQRTQGFKGFNQHSVSIIIKATDPRKFNSLNISAKNYQNGL